MARISSNSSGGNVQVSDSNGNPINATGGALDVNIVTVGPGGNQQSLFNEITGIASGITTTILSYTVPAGKTFNLSRVEVSGDNVATYSVLINNVVNGVMRTYFGAPLNATFDYSDSSLQGGYQIAAGINITVQVVHMRPSAGTFEARVQGIQV